MLFSTFMLFLLLCPNAYAYLDGGTGSMLLQLMLGGVAGMIAILRLYWHKILSVFSKKYREEHQEEHNQQEEKE